VATTLGIADLLQDGPRSSDDLATVTSTHPRTLYRLLRELRGRPPHPRATVIDSWTLQSSPESGARAGFDGAKKRTGSKVHLAVDTLGHLLALTVTPAIEVRNMRASVPPCGAYEVSGMGNILGAPILFVLDNGGMRSRGGGGCLPRGRSRLEEEGVTYSGC